MNTSLAPTREGQMLSTGEQSESVAAASHELPDFIHYLLRSLIGYADQKAGFVFLAAASLLGYLAGAGATEPLQGEGWSALELRDWVGIAAFALSTATALLAAAVFAPGHRPQRSGTLLDWREFPHEQGVAAYVAEIESLSGADARAEVLRHCYILGSICRSKHRVLDLAFRVGFFALACTIVFGASG